ncbi:glycerol-3-phosphate O-acyltransferase 2 [Homalodisca vitripennis]|nr:glycerol-3-phosphate O-acyltransferase 2 [Homalodisca vitripennis]
MVVCTANTKITTKTKTSTGLEQHDHNLDQDQDSFTGEKFVVVATIIHRRRRSLLVDSLVISTINLAVGSARFSITADGRLAATSSWSRAWSVRPERTTVVVRLSCVCRVLGVKKPFEDLIEADTGDIADQKLITFVRQVTAAACLPELLDDTTFPDDVKSRVQNLLQHFQGNSIGTRILRLRRSSKKSSYSEERKEFLHF